MTRQLSTLRHLHLRHRAPIKIYGVDGKLVRVLAYGQRFPAGRHVLARDGRNTSGLRAGSGNYFVQVQAGAWSSRQKVVCLQ